MWDLASGDKVSELKGHIDVVRSVAWSQDGQRIASGSSDKNVHLWDAGSGEQVTVSHTHELIDSLG